MYYLVSVIYVLKSWHAVVCNRRKACCYIYVSLKDFILNVLSFWVEMLQRRYGFSLGTYFPLWINYLSMFFNISETSIISRLKRCIWSKPKPNMRHFTVFCPTVNPKMLSYVGVQTAVLFYDTVDRILSLWVRCLLHCHIHFDRYCPLQQISVLIYELPYRNAS